ncbi:MAG: hypothetical protein DHS20C18_52440 [Saprospiraceae bacterium]|nr:MAG: hypothetical protein DHS20C18_52440 [Saprospiraceae bacterium]
MRLMKQLLIVFCIGLLPVLTSAQPAVQYAEVEPNRFDYGKMWTLEYAPLDYFEQTYGFRPDKAWLENVRMSSLRFSSFCSASFVSAQGLVMTNHHCSRGEVGKVMKEGEDFDKTGFYATTAEEERRVSGLYVKQLARIADVSKTVESYTKQAKTDEEIPMWRDSAMQVLVSEYQVKEDWKDLEIEPVVYYSGGRYSLYGYKRYDDVRLVLIPELQLGYFGGDPDNFTFPRYNLDCTFWRVYDDGKPLDTENFHFKFNAEGAKEGEVVFVVGNPGSTERYRTMAQLEFDRDYRYNSQLKWMEDRVSLMEKKYEIAPSHDLQEDIFGMANGVKAINGIVEGMHDPQLMGKKATMEKLVKSKSKAVASGNDYWQQLADAYEPLKGNIAEINLLGPGANNGSTIQVAHQMYNYLQSLGEKEPEEEDKLALQEQIQAAAQGMGSDFEVNYLETVLSELQQFAGPDDTYVQELLDGRTPEVAAKEMLEETVFNKPEKLKKLLSGKAKKLQKSKDPVIKFAQLAIPKFYDAVAIFRSSGPHRQELSKKIANEIYQIYGLDIPPDATFTLRIADGVVKGYDYNGTTAPYKTTFFGLYDRYYSHEMKFPWSLPEKWLNPPIDLLKAPFNFVSTNDIIGGNSGSPIINKKGEVVGLVFDGNIESLPGNFIYDERVNRSVSVHAGGMAAALKYIYKADRILKELGVE